MATEVTKMINEAVEQHCGAADPAGEPTAAAERAPEAAPRPPAES